MMRDSCSEAKVVPALYPTRVADNTPIVGPTIDLLGNNTCTIYIAAGTLADIDATFTVLVEDSADNSTFAAVDDTYLIGTEAAASFLFSDDNTAHKIGYVGPKRYARLTITPANNTGNADLGAVAVLAGARHR
jgi:hypothetical protein